ncbi:polyketide synthase, partial [Candidatus Magnetomorum sp. HK-1]
VFNRSEERYSIQGLIKKLMIIPSYHALFHELISILLKNNYVQMENDQLITLEKVEYIKEQLDNQPEQLLSLFPELNHFVHLLQTCVSAYPKILTGQESHMNVMFPNGRLDLVEKIYSDNTIADYYNDLLSHFIERYIQQRINLNNGLIHIMEVGAGTGSTTGFVL